MSGNEAGNRNVFRCWREVDRDGTEITWSCRYTQTTLLLLSLGHTMLHLAVSRGHLSCCEALLTVTVWPVGGTCHTVRHCSLWLCVASRGHLSCCEALLTVTVWLVEGTCHAVRHCSLWLCVASRGHLSCCEALLTVTVWPVGGTCHAVRHCPLWLCVASRGHLSCCEALLTVTVCGQSGAPVMLWVIAHCDSMCA